MMITAHFTGGPLDGDTQDIDIRYLCRFSGHPGRYIHTVMGTMTAFNLSQESPAVGQIKALMGMRGYDYKGHFVYHNYDPVDPGSMFSEGGTVEFVYAGAEESEGYDIVESSGRLTVEWET